MATKRGWSSWRAIALSEESAYGTAATIGTTSFVEHFESDPLVPIAVLEDGTVLIGTEAEEVNEQDVLAWGVEGSHEARCRPNTLALLTAFCLGNISHTAVGEPGAGYYTHTITPRPKTFLSAQYKKYTASTIAFVDATTKKITDSANGLADFLTNDTIVVSGSGSNDGTYTIATGGVAAEIVVDQALTAETAGASVTITHDKVTVDDTGCFPSTGTIVFEDDGEEWAYDTKTATTFDHATLPVATHADNTGVYLKQTLDTFVMPSMTLYDKIGATGELRWPGVLVNSLTLSGERKGWVRIAATLIGMGSSTSPTITKPTAITDETYLKVGDCTITRSGTWDGRTFSGGTSLNAKVRSFSWTFNNNCADADYLFGSGLYRGRGERSRRGQELSVELELNDLTWLGYLTGQTAVNLEIDMIASGSYGGKLIFPQLKVSSLSRTGGTGILLESAGCRIQEHSTYGSVQIEVINKKSGYLH